MISTLSGIFLFSVLLIAIVIETIDPKKLKIRLFIILSISILFCAIAIIIIKYNIK